jgi:glycoside/pentoside/hexuronide:cation symporter, GPH family
MKRVCRNRAFLLMAGAVAAAIVGVFATYGVSPYLIIFYVQHGDQSKGAVHVAFNSLSWLGTCLVLAGPILWLSQKVGKRNAMMICLGVAFTSCCFRWMFYNPNAPWLSLIPYACFGCGINSIVILAPSMTADICDTEELKYGYRNGGMFSAFYSWTIKFGMTFGFVCAGLLLDLSKFKATETLLLPQTVLQMRIYDSAVPAIGLAISLGLLARYPITIASMEKVTAGLDSRKQLDKK